MSSVFDPAPVAANSAPSMVARFAMEWHALLNPGKMRSDQPAMEG